MIAILLIAFNVIARINCYNGNTQIVESECSGRDNLQVQLSKCSSEDCSQIQKGQSIGVLQEIDFSDYNNQKVKIELENANEKIILDEVEFKCASPKSKSSSKVYQCVSHKKFMSNKKSGGVKIFIRVPPQTRNGLYSLRIIYENSEQDSPCVAYQVVEVLDSDGSYDVRGRAVVGEQKSVADEMVDSLLGMAVSRLKDLELNEQRFDVLQQFINIDGGVLLHKAMVRGIETTHRSKPTQVTQISETIEQTIFTVEIRNLSMFANGTLFMKQYKVRAFFKVDLDVGEFEVKLHKDLTNGRNKVNEVKFIQFQGFNVIAKTTSQVADDYINNALKAGKEMAEPLVKKQIEAALAKGIETGLYYKNLYDKFANLGSMFG